MYTAKETLTLTRIRIQRNEHVTKMIKLSCWNVVRLCILPLKYHIPLQTQELSSFISHIHAHVYPRSVLHEWKSFIFYMAISLENSTTQCNTEQRTNRKSFLRITVWMSLFIIPDIHIYLITVWAAKAPVITISNHVCAIGTIYRTITGYRWRILYNWYCNIIVRAFYRWWWIQFPCCRGRVIIIKNNYF